MNPQFLISSRGRYDNCLSRYLH